jgi:hypothetical protein
MGVAAGGEPSADLVVAPSMAKGPSASVSKENLLVKWCIRFRPCFRCPVSESKGSQHPLRGSRRGVAGAGVEFQMGEIARRSTKRAMRSLSIIGENDGIDQQAKEEYAKVFSEPLSDSHIKALAALFGWSSLDSREAGERSLPLASCEGSLSLAS